MVTGTIYWMLHELTGCECHDVFNLSIMLQVCGELLTPPPTSWRSYKNKRETIDYFWQSKEGTILTFHESSSTSWIRLEFRFLALSSALLIPWIAFFGRSKSNHPKSSQVIPSHPKTSQVSSGAPGAWWCRWAAGATEGRRCRWQCSAGGRWLQWLWWLWWLWLALDLEQCQRAHRIQHSGTSL